MSKNTKANKTTSQLFSFEGKDDLLYILGMGRPHDGANEQKLGFHLVHDYGCEAFADKDGAVAAYVLSIPHADGSASKTLFSSHTDTVDGKDCAHYLLEDDKGSGRLFTDGKTILGADDGAGVWLMLRMIGAGVPGTYVFNRGEECGGIGSSALARDYADWLQQFDKAVAFDRARDHSVITHQGGSRCCSDDFAEALADKLSQLCDDEYLFAPDDSGIYTDTAEWTHLIPECTNLSVGYEMQHSTSESLDMRFLAKLAEIVVSIDWDALPVSRDPSKVEQKTWGFGNTKQKYSLPDFQLSDFVGMSTREIEDIVYSEPEAIAEMIASLVSGTSNSDEPYVYVDLPEEWK